MTDHHQPPSDAQLEEQTRAGSQEAWIELRGRHVGAIESLAGSRSRRTSQATTDSVFEQLRSEITTDAPGELDAPPVRVRAIGALTGGTYGPTWAASAPPQPPAPPAPAPAPADVDDPATSGEIDRATLTAVATAFGRLPTAWQTVLWHRWVEQIPAASLTAILGRSAAEVMSLEQTAQRGLVDGYAQVVVAADPGPDRLCVPVIPLLGPFRRGTLAEAERRSVEAHLGADGATSPGCAACRRRLQTIDDLAVVLPVAIAPGLTGLPVDSYRAAIGAGVAAFGVAALAAQRSARDRRRARIGAVAAVVLALVAAAFFVREPFGDLDSELADLLERVTPTTEPTDTTPTTPTTAPDDGGAGPESLPNRIELVFPGAPQGAVYVPGGRALNLAVSLGAPAPVYAGATGTIDVAITNNDAEDASVRFTVRSSTGVAFDRLLRGVGTCLGDQGNGARCTLSLPAGATAEMSLRFTVAADVPDRLVVVPSIRSDILEVPVEFVSGLLVGQVGQGELRTAGADLGPCSPSPDCPAGQRDASSAVLDLPAGDTIERAVLVWDGDVRDADWADTVGLIPAGSSTAARIVAEIPEPGVNPEPPVGSGFRSVADVSDLVRSAGAGTYTVVRAPSATEAGSGSWTLIVITESAVGPPRLFVVVRPDGAALPDAPVRVDIPIGGSTTPVTPLRPLRVVLQTATVGSGVNQVTVNGQVVDETRSLDDTGSATTTVTYDLEIASTEDDLSLVASTSAASLRVTSVGLAADIVP